MLQFGGAAGTLAALGEQGLDVAERLAALLDLPLPDAPWHTHRDRLAEVAAALAILAGTCGKIARDVALMMQTEVGEAFEPAAPGRGGSSTLPHKRNPVGAAAALSAATIAPNLVATMLAAQVQEHERAAGGWQTEWMTFPALALVTSGALSAVVDIAEGLEIDVERMRANLESSGGSVMAEAVSFALAEKMGRAEAHASGAGTGRQAAQGEARRSRMCWRESAGQSAPDASELERLLHAEPLSGLGTDLHRPAGCVGAGPRSPAQQQRRASDRSQNADRAGGRSLGDLRRNLVHQGPGARCRGSRREAGAERCSRKVRRVAGTSGRRGLRAD